MANRDAPNGFRVVGHLAGGVCNRLSRYHIPDGGSNAIARGDAVIPLSTTKQIDRPGGDAVRLLGVFDGCIYVDTNGDIQFRPRWPAAQAIKAGTTVDAFVYDDPKLIFEGQYNGTLAATDVGSLSDVSRGTSNANTGQSGDELKANAGSGANLKILDLVERPDNDYGSKAKVLFAIALHYYAGAMTTI